jgi:hypothetical protein
MRLNPDCMRDVLLVAEENLPLNGSLPMSDLLPLLPGYSKDEITYTCLKLNEANLLNIFKTPYPGGTFVNDIREITYNGHQFLENIRNQSTWETVKQKLSLLGSSSVPVIMSVASQVILNKISSSL